MGVSKELLMRRRNLGSPHIATATGAIASFAGNMAAPLKECKCEFTPVQSGTGDPSPQNVRPISGWTGANISRTGINIWDEEWEVGSIDNSTGQNSNDSTNIRAKNYIIVQPSTSYCIYKAAGIGGIRYYWYALDKTFISSDVGSTVITSPSNAFYLRIRTTSSYGNTFNHDFCVNYPSTDTSYHPYTGSTYPMTFPATKNLCDGIAYDCGISNDKPKIFSTTPITSPYTTYFNYGGAGFFAQVKAGVTYVLSSDVTGAGSGFHMALYSSIEDALDRANILQYAAGETFTPNSDGYLLFMRYNASSGTTVTWTYAQCEVGSTATAYEPYGTVYGGYVDPVRGVLVAEWANIASYNGETLPAEWKSDRDVYSAGGTPTTGAQVVYKLATPVTYQLTPQVIKTLKGVNNVFTDLNGNTTVKYWKH